MPQESFERSPGQVVKCQEDSSIEKQEKLKPIKVQATKANLCYTENHLLGYKYLTLYRAVTCNSEDMHFHMRGHLIVQ